MPDTSHSLGSCPVPPSDGDTIESAHGAGGRRTLELIEQVFLSAFENPALSARHDGAIVDVGGTRLAFSTDSYVVTPLFFPGGNIGDLAVNGTANDLAMCGARPLYLSAGFILEEGFSLGELRRVVDSMRRAAETAGVRLVTGDTKVVERGKGDGLFVNTAGIGVVESPDAISPAMVRPGDSVLLSGDIGRHGVAVIGQRENLVFDTPVESDTMFLWPAVDALLRNHIPVHCLRDLTRGGLATALNEIAISGRAGVVLDEATIPVLAAVSAVCELLGFDPLYVANEGRFVAFVPEEHSSSALSAMRTAHSGASAVRIGRVVDHHPGTLMMSTATGGMRVLDLLSGEQLPRIC